MAKLGVDTGTSECASLLPRVNERLRSSLSAPTPPPSTGSRERRIDVSTELPGARRSGAQPAASKPAYHRFADDQRTTSEGPNITVTDTQEPTQVTSGTGSQPVGTRRKSSWSRAILLPELQQLAASLGINTTKMRKSDLVAAIQNRQTPVASADGHATDSAAVAAQLLPMDGAAVAVAPRAETTPASVPERPPAAADGVPDQGTSVQERPARANGQAGARGAQPGGQPSSGQPAGGAGQQSGNARTRETADVAGAGATAIAGAATRRVPDSRRAQPRMPSRPSPRTTFSFRSQESSTRSRRRTPGSCGRPASLARRTSTSPIPTSAGSACGAAMPSPARSGNPATANAARSTTRWSAWTR